MGTYGIKGVIHAWDMGKLTTEQAIGQVLLLLADLHERLTSLERQRRRGHHGIDLSRSEGDGEQESES